MRGERYYRPDTHSDLAYWLEGNKHLYLSYAAALEFYAAIVKAKWFDDDAKALLGCNDRFFLLTGLLRRVDANKEWLYYRCREVEIEPDQHLDLWAREHYKSTIITFAGVIQEILVDPEITVGIFSFRKDKAEEFLTQIMREFESNERLVELYHDVLFTDPKKQSPKWSQGEGLIVRREGNPKEATITASGLVDGMPTGSHFKLMVYDDVVTDKSVTNPEMVKKTTEAWELSDNLGSGETRKWHIGTRYSFADTYGVILERGVLKQRIYPATDNGKLEGKPVFFTTKLWEDKKKTQRSTIAAQMLQNPLAGSENTFDPRTFRSYEIRPSILNVYIMGDPSKGATRTSDRTAIAVIGIDIHGNKYLLDGYRHRMKLSERWQVLKQLWLKWTVEPGVQMVKVGWERYGAQTDDEYFDERMRMENVSFQLHELAWPRQGNHSKTDRVERLEPDFRAGKFFLPALMHEQGIKECTWEIKESHVQRRALKGRKPRAIQDMIDSNRPHMAAKVIRRLDEDRKPYDLTSCLIEEMLFFPFSPKDDLVDAVSRIYDMEPITPSLWEDKVANEGNQFEYEDA